MENNAYILTSGGLDSTTLLYWARQRYDQIEAVSFDYGLKHNQIEREYLIKTCQKLNIKLNKINIDFIKRSFKSSLLSDDEVVPQERYEKSNMIKTVVPFRNGIFLAILAGLAESNNIQNILIGNHGGDHAIYPDCTEEFILAMQKAIEMGTYNKIKLVSPFCNYSKADIVKLGAELNVDFSLTYSCYNGREKHCGKCSACLERKEAFKTTQIKDPTIYEE
jgi:7-cyano-7-deazaguanine synthase